VGDQVEILTGSEASPSRDWLNSDLGFVRSARARAKIKHWFKSQDRDVNIKDGKEMLTKELRRFNINKINMVQLAEALNLTTEDDLFAAIGANDVRLMHAVHHAEEIIHPPKPKEIQLRESKEQNHSGDLIIRGVGNMMTTIANCCKPVPGDAVAGYITLGRGVSIHKDDCVNLLQLRNKEQERIIDVSWGNDVSTTYPVELHIAAYDRTGLLADIMTVLANIGINVVGMQTITDKSHNSCDMRVTVEVESIDSLGRIMSLLTKIPNISDVRRGYSS
jgi:GTP pyrophosphokinase